MEEENKEIETLGNTAPIETITTEPVVEQPAAPAVEQPAAPAVEPVAPVAETPVEATPVAPVEAAQVEQPVAPAPAEAPAEPASVEPAVEPAQPAPEEPKKKGKGGLILIIILLLAVGGFAVWYFVLGGNGSKKEENKVASDQGEKQEEKKEDEPKEDNTEQKEEEPKEDNTEQTVYKSKYDGKTDAEIYDAIQAETEYLKHNDITGTSDDIVTKSLLFLTQRYSHFIKLNENSTGFMPYDDCSYLNSFNIDKNNLNKDIICLANLESKDSYLKNAEPGTLTNPPTAFIITETAKTKLLEYYPAAKLQTIKEVCGDKYTSDEDENSLVAYTGLAVAANEKSFDLTKVVKSGENYKATVTSYRKYNTMDSPQGPSYEKVDKETFVFNITVKNNHIVFGTVE